MDTETLPPEASPPDSVHGGRRIHHHHRRHPHSRHKTRRRRRLERLGMVAFIILVLLVGVYAWVLSGREHPPHSGLEVPAVRLLG